jgi:hypothetical protein
VDTVDPLIPREESAGVAASSLYLSLAEPVATVDDPGRTQRTADKETVDADAEAFVV